MNGIEVAGHVVPLDAKIHDRSSFTSGAPDLDRYLREHATQDERRDLARVFVTPGSDAALIRGYYTLSAASVRRERLPPDRARRLPQYPVPAALLGRLAVDRRHQGRGLGSHLLLDALYRVRAAARALAVHVVIVDALNDAAADFYGKYGFLRLEDDRRRLFIPMATVNKLTSIPGV